MEVQLHGGANNLVRVNVDGDHRLDLGVFTLEGLESTMHNKVLNGKLRGIHLPSSLKELELPCCGIAMVREVLHTFHGLYATSGIAHLGMLPHSNNSKRVTSTLVHEVGDEVEIGPLHDSK